MASLAFVVQRYGQEIVGGSESLCRVVAEMVAQEHSVDVLTSCAKDYLTWKNEYPSGVSTLNGVTVYRFPVDAERGMAAHQLMGQILGGVTLEAYHGHKELIRATIARSSEQDQVLCMKLQGPYSTPLFQHLSDHSRAYDLVIFFTYLYPTTFFGVRYVPAGKTILVPTAHDEAPIFFPVFRKVFEDFPAHIFLTPEERAFVEKTFKVDHAAKATIGMPVELTVKPDPEHFRQKFGISGPFLLYAGRIDPSKGCDELFRFYGPARRHLKDDLQLVLIGNQAMKIPTDPHIHYLGVLSEQDKVDSMAAATLLINPSPFESFSIVILEAMLCGTPVLVNGRCAVLKGHACRSQAGLYYTDYYEFVEALRWLLAHDAERQRMGADGCTYVQQNYGRKQVHQRYSAFLNARLKSGWG